MHQNAGLVQSVQWRYLHGVKFATFYRPCGATDRTMQAVCLTDDFEMEFVCGRSVHFEVDVYGDYDAFQKFLTMIRLVA